MIFEIRVYKVFYFEEERLNFFEVYSMLGVKSRLSVLKIPLGQKVNVLGSV